MDGISYNTLNYLISLKVKRPRYFFDRFLHVRLQQHPSLFFRCNKLGQYLTGDNRGNARGTRR